MYTKIFFMTISYTKKANYDSHSLHINEGLPKLQYTITTSKCTGKRDNNFLSCIQVLKCVTPGLSLKNKTPKTTPSPHLALKLHTLCK